MVAPLEKIRRPKVAMPELKLSETKAARFEHLLEITSGLPAISMAVVQHLVALPPFEGVAEKTWADESG